MKTRHFVVRVSKTAELKRSAKIYRQKIMWKRLEFKSRLLIRWAIMLNEWLKKHRGVCFEQIAILMEHEEVLDVIAHPNQNEYPNQKVAIIVIDDYVYLAPYVQEGDDIFFKTRDEAKQSRL